MSANNGVKFSYQGLKYEFIDETRNSLQLYVLSESLPQLSVLAVLRHTAGMYCIYAHFCI